jgi:hypothetical protein
LRSPLVDHSESFASDYCSGMAQIDRFEYVQVGEPPPTDDSYCAVKVVLPALGRVRTNDALSWFKSLPWWINAFRSVAATVFAPLAANPMWQSLEAASPNMPAVTDTSTFFEAGTVTVTKGPGLAGLTVAL